MRAPSEVCPRCGAGLVSARGAAAWCPTCEWNLALYEPDRHGRAIGWLWADRAVDRFAHRLARTQFARMSGRPVGKPGWSLARLVMVAISVVLLACQVAILGAGIWLITVDFPSAAIILGVLLVMVALMLRPRFGKLDSAARALSRSDAPTLFAVVYRVADAVGARRPHTVAVIADFNATAGTVGVLRRRVLTIGLPLWVALTPQQRAALLAHEMGHFVNGDPARGLLTQPAFSTLGYLAYLTAPIPVDPDAGLLFAIAAWAVNVPMAIASSLFRLAHIMLVVAGLRDKRRAEYLADEVSARVAGSAAAVELIDILAASEEVRFAIRWAARESALVTDWRAAAQAGRPAGRSRTSVLRQLSVRDEASLFASHPPAGLRARLIESRPPELGSLAINEAEAIRIDTELAKHYAQVRRDFIHGGY